MANIDQLKKLTPETTTRVTKLTKVTEQQKATNRTIKSMILVKKEIKTRSSALEHLKRSRWTCKLPNSPNIYPTVLERL